jgi:hypothetical protein
MQVHKVEQRRGQRTDQHYHQPYIMATKQPHHQSWFSGLSFASCIKKHDSPSKYEALLLPQGAKQAILLADPQISFGERRGGLSWQLV